jgi:hypothetical protein
MIQSSNPIAGLARCVLILPLASIRSAFSKGRLEPVNGLFPVCFVYSRGGMSSIPAKAKDPYGVISRPRAIIITFGDKP